MRFVDYTEFFYSNYVGKYPFDSEEKRIRTTQVIDHLKDSFLTDKEIFNIFELCAKDGYIDINNLPDNIWDNSLTAKGSFYYHSELQIKSKPPCFDYISGVNIVYPYYCEMISQYTLDDLLQYAYIKLGIQEFFRDYNRDLGAIKYLLKKYIIDEVTSLDFVLYLIDEAAANDVSQIINVNQYEKEAYERIKSIIRMAKAKHYNQIIWRWNAN